MTTNLESYVSNIATSITPYVASAAILASALLGGCRSKPIPMDDATKAAYVKYEKNLYRETSIDTFVKESVGGFQKYAEKSSAPVTLPVSWETYRAAFEAKFGTAAGDARQALEYVADARNLSRTVLAGADAQVANAWSQILGLAGEYSKDLTGEQRKGLASHATGVLELNETAMRSFSRAGEDLATKLRAFESYKTQVVALRDFAANATDEKVKTGLTNLFSEYDRNLGAIDLRLKAQIALLGSEAVYDLVGKRINLSDDIQCALTGSPYTNQGKVVYDTMRKEVVEAKKTEEGRRQLRKDPTFADIDTLLKQIVAHFEDRDANWQDDVARDQRHPIAHAFATRYVLNDAADKKISADTLTGCLYVLDGEIVARYQNTAPDAKSGIISLLARIVFPFYAAIDSGINDIPQLRKPDTITGNASEVLQAYTASWAGFKEPDNYVGAKSGVYGRLAVNSLITILDALAFAGALGGNAGNAESFVPGGSSPPSGGGRIGGGESQSNGVGGNRRRDNRLYGPKPWMHSRPHNSIKRWK